MKTLTMAALTAAALAAGPALAAGSPDYQTSVVRSTLAEQEQVYAPKGFQRLCAERPELCVNSQTDGEVSHVLSRMESMFGGAALKQDAPELTPERLQTLNQVNLAVNATIFPEEDRGGDTWSLNALSGDCEEYVLMKREVLARLGWPRSAMRIAVVRNAGDAPYHAVLVITTRNGDYVLDNLTDHLTTVAQSPYDFVVSQSFERPGAWVRVNNLR